VPAGSRTAVRRRIRRLVVGAQVHLGGVSTCRRALEQQFVDESAAVGTRYLLLGPEPEDVEDLVDPVVDQGVLAVPRDQRPLVLVQRLERLHRPPGFLVAVPLVPLFHPLVQIMTGEEIGIVVGPVGECRLAHARCTTPQGEPSKS
jgi:hypothetical protein